MLNTMKLIGKIKMEMVSSLFLEDLFSNQEFELLTFSDDSILIDLHATSRMLNNNNCLGSSQCLNTNLWCQLLMFVNKFSLNKCDFSWLLITNWLIAFLKCFKLNIEFKNYHCMRISNKRMISNHVMRSIIWFNYNMDLNTQIDYWYDTKIYIQTR